MSDDEEIFLEDEQDYIEDENSETFIFTPNFILSQGKKKDDSAILRFTEIFGPLPQKYDKDPYVIKAKKIRNKEAVDLVHVEKEPQVSQEIQCEKLEYHYKVREPADLRGVSTDDSETRKQVNEDIIIEETEEMVERTEFNPLDLIEWENNIIWDTGDGPVYKRPEIHKPMIAGEGKKIIRKPLNPAMWGSMLHEVEVPDEKPPVMPFQNPSMNTMGSPQFPQRLPGQYPFNMNAMQMQPKVKLGPMGSPNPMPMFPNSPMFPINQFPNMSPVMMRPPMMFPTPSPSAPVTPKFVPPPMPPPATYNPPSVPTTPVVVAPTVPTIGPDGKKLRKKYTRRKKVSGDNEDEYIEESEEKREIRRILSKVKNQDLENGKWMDQVVWDEDTPHVPMNTKLILDLNDKMMFFEKKVDGPVTELNHFNMSNDKDYEIVTSRAFVQQRKGRHIVKHSLPALYLHGSLYRTYLDGDELKKLHRTRYFFHINRPLIISYQPPKKEKAYRRKQKPIMRIEELSAHDHRVVLMEYVEENPPILNNVGMATKIVTYFKKKEGEDSHRVEDGIPVVMEIEDALPLIGRVEESKPLMSTENTLFSAQIFKQKPLSTDFLVTTVAGSTGTRFLIRPIPAIFTVGHTQSHVECPTPNSKQAVQFQKNRLLLYLCREFSQGTHIKMEDVRSTFPTMTDGTVRKRLGEVADYQKTGGDSGYWTRKPEFEIPPQDSLLDLVTPEMVCLNEAMEAGAWRLEELGISTDATMAGVAIMQNGGSLAKYKNVVRFIEKERMNLPWNKTINFLNSCEGREGSTIESLGIANQVLRKEELGRVVQQVKDMLADTEKTTQIHITHEEAAKILLQSGMYDEEKVKAMKRPEKKQTARKLLEQYGQYGKKSVMKEQAKTNKFKEIIADMFVKEATKIESGAPYYDSEDDNALNSDEDFDLEKDLEKGKSDDEMSQGSQGEQSPVSKKKYFAKKTTIITHPDGRKEEKVEFIRDQEKVAFYQKRAELTGGDKKSKLEGTELLKSGVKDKRRIQDSFRRWKKEQTKGLGPMDPPKERKKKPLDPNAPIRQRKPSNKPMKNITCGACGGQGHMSTNKMCPKWNETNQVKREDMKNGDHTPTQNGLKIKIHQSLLGDGTRGDDSRQQTRKRRKTPADEISEIFSEVLTKIRQAPQAAAFLNPVDTSQYRDYKKIVQKPIDLSIIQRRNQDLKYSHPGPFLADIELMVENARKYCAGKFDEIVANADEVLRIATEEVAKIDVKIVEIHNAPTTPMTPRTPMFNPKKKKKPNLSLDVQEGSLGDYSSGSVETPQSQGGFSDLGSATSTETPQFDESSPPFN